MNKKHARAAWPRGVLAVGRGGGQEGKAAVLVEIVTDSRGLDWSHWTRTKEGEGESEGADERTGRRRGERRSEEGEGRRRRGRRREILTEAIKKWRTQSPIRVLSPTSAQFHSPKHHRSSGRCMLARSRRSLRFTHLISTLVSPTKVKKDT